MMLERGGGRPSALSCVAVVAAALLISAVDAGRQLRTATPTPTPTPTSTPDPTVAGDQFINTCEVPDQLIPALTQQVTNSVELYSAVQSTSCPGANVFIVPPFQSNVNCVDSAFGRQYFVNFRTTLQCTWKKSFVKPISVAATLTLVRHRLVTLDRLIDCPP